MHDGERVPNYRPVDLVPPELESVVMARNGTQRGDEIAFLCPAHDDHHPSARWNPSKGVWHCDACGAGGGVLDLADRLGVPRPVGTRGGGGVYPSDQRRNSATPPGGCTLTEFAEAKNLPLDFLKSLGWTDLVYQGERAVRIPYRLPDGSESSAVRFRFQMAKTNPDLRFRWKKNSKPHLYGLDRIAEYDNSYILLVEGESDTVTGLYHGLPGAGNWKDARDAEHLARFETIYIVIEPDSGGEAVRSWVAASRIRDRVRFVRLDPYKDLSEAHVAGVNVDASAFAEAVPWAEQEAQEDRRIRDLAWATGKHLLLSPRLLDEAVATVRARGVVGMDRNIALYYLILTSRVLNRPISAAIKGPSSAGKSFAVDETLRLFPSSAYLTLTSMSDKALAYGEESLAHRHLLIYEAAGMSGDTASYLIRTLLSEGKIIHETVEKTADGLKPRKIVREGPTGFITTTTSASLHPENETRMLSIPVPDNKDQTKAIFRALAESREVETDYESWHAVQVWIDHANHDVVIPFADVLANEVPPIAVRLRRDFGQVLSFIRTHAILYQAQRKQDAEGRIIATLDDYEVVRNLVHGLMSAGIGATIPAPVRETVNAVAELAALDEGPVSLPDIVERLDLDKSAVSRRVKVAVADGYLINQEEKRGRPAKIIFGEPLPHDIDILPTRARLEECCTVARESEGIENTLPLPDDDASARGEGEWEGEDL